MWNEPTKKQLEAIPKLYETEHIPLQDKLIHLHFFIGGCDWYISEFDGDLFWRFAILNEDFVNAEWGYISFGELKDGRNGGWIEIDTDPNWEDRSTGQASAFLVEALKHKGSIEKLTGNRCELRFPVKERYFALKTKIGM